jgi:energy-coupling factor transporter transmembrane protein EcfT
MVSWPFAFKRGTVIFLWVLLWFIIGSIIILVFSLPLIVYSLSNLTNLSNLTSLPSIPFAQIGLLIIGYIIGILVITIGTYSTIVKITLEATEKRIGMQIIPVQAPATPPPPQQP